MPSQTGSLETGLPRPMHANAAPGPAGYGQVSKLNASILTSTIITVAVHPQRVQGATVARFD